MGYMETIKQIPGLLHYYPLDSTFQLRDQVGTAHMTNAGGVSFGSTTANGFTVDAARFTGGSTSYLTIPNSIDWSVDTIKNSAGALTGKMFIIASLTVDNWAQGGSGNGERIHWMGKGGHGNQDCEWLLRLYRVPGTGQATARPRRHSAYYFNPGSGSVWPNFPPGGQGAGDYLQPLPQGADGGEWSNMTDAQSTDAGTAGVEKNYGALFSLTGGSGDLPGYAQVSWNDIKHSYGSGAHFGNPSYMTRPLHGNAVVKLGTADDGDGYLIGRVRRVAVFNRELTTAELTTLKNAMSLQETDSSLPPPTGNPGVDTFVESFASVDTAKYDVTGSANASVTGGALKLVAGTTSPTLTTKAVAPWALTTAGIYARMLPAASSTANTAVTFSLVNNASTTAEFGIRLITEATGAIGLRAGILASGAFSTQITPVTYDPTAHAFVRIAFTSTGAVGFYASPRKPTSPSDNPWVLLGSVTAPSYTGAVRIKYAQTSPSAQTLYSQVANVNGAAGTIVPPVVVTPPPLPTPGGVPLIDDFDEGLNTAFWDQNSGTPTVAGGVLALDAATTADQLSASTLVNLTGTREFIEVQTVPNAGTSYGLFRMQIDANNALEWLFKNGAAQARQQVSGAYTNVGGPIAFNATATKFFAIREAAGKIYFEYGPSSAQAQLIAVEPAGRNIPLAHVIALKVILKAQAA